MVKEFFPHPPSLPLALIIDLEAVVHNYRMLCSRLQRGAFCAAVLKANAYGMGLKEVASRLYQEGCRHFFVAHLTEAIELKSYIGQDVSIYVLNGLRRGDEEVYFHYDLIPVLSDPLQIHVWNTFCQNKQQPLKATLHFDTGMSRTGLSLKAAQNLGILQISHMEIVCVMSHLACAYDPTHPMNETQRLAFDGLRKRFPFALGSLSGTGGFFLGPQYHYDLIRAGLALTGCPSADDTLRPVLKAYAQILQINDIQAGESVGYNATFKASRPSRLATLGVGYADGYLRSLSNRGEVYFKGQKFPVVGTVSMDLLTIDITDALPNKIQPGDWVELFGDNIWADKLAEKAGTVPWEIFTRLSPRFERFYINAIEAQEAA